MGLDPVFGKQLKKIGGQPQTAVPHPFNGKPHLVRPRVEDPVGSGDVVLEFQKDIAIFELIDILGFSSVDLFHSCTVGCYGLKVDVGIFSLTSAKDTTLMFC